MDEINLISSDEEEEGDDEEDAEDEEGSEQPTSSRCRLTHDPLTESSIHA